MKNANVNEMIKAGNEVLANNKRVYIVLNFVNIKYPVDILGVSEEDTSFETGYVTYRKDMTHELLEEYSEILEFEAVDDTIYISGIANQDIVDSYKKEGFLTA